MKILLVVEKQSIKKIYAEAIKDLNINSSIDIDVINPIFEIDDGVILFREFKENIYCNNKIVKDMNFLNIDELNLPQKKFLWREKNEYIKQLEYKNDYDLVIGACDPDICGNLGFYKYIQERNIKDAKWIEVMELRKEYIQEKISNLNDYIEDFDNHLKDILKSCEENDFKAQIQRGENGFDLFMETSEKFKTLQNFSKYFGIPYRTVQNWQCKVNKCPKYLYDLIEYKLLTEGILCGDKVPIID